MTRARRLQEVMRQRRERRQIRQRKKSLEHFRDWLHSHPNRVDPELRPAAIDYMNGSIAELDKLLEMKNTRPARRMSLRDRLKTLVVAIVTQTPYSGK